MDRMSFHRKLLAIPGLKKVYYQPPSTDKLEFPCIVYSLYGLRVKDADNEKMIVNRRYNVILIDKNPDSPIFDEMLKLDYCRFDRSYSTNNMTHFVFTINY